MELVNRYKCHGGWVEIHQHSSKTVNTPMRFAVYLPPQAATKRVPILYWLSGLSCNEENFITKANAQITAAKYGICLVAPDTSPRGANIPGEKDHWDFGIAAGFYVNATEEKWRHHYRMYDYVTIELPELIKSHFSVDAERESIFGHSMGGHGALVIGLRNPGRYRSLSSFAPIVAPMQCPWGKKAFSGYLGSDSENWKDYDSTELIRKWGYDREILVDQGTADSFLKEQLKPELLEKVCQEKSVKLNLRYREGYDHGYYFIQSFMSEHIDFHARALLE